MTRWRSVLRMRNHLDALERDARDLKRSVAGGGHSLPPLR
jgi:hypothetical protein